MEHPTAAALAAALDDIRRSPRDQGRVDLIVRRPAVNAREVLTEARLERAQGLVGDTWRVRPSNPTRDRPVNGSSLRLMPRLRRKPARISGNRSAPGAVTDVDGQPKRSTRKKLSAVSLFPKSSSNAPSGVAPIRSVNEMRRCITGSAQRLSR